VLIVSQFIFGKERGPDLQVLDSAVFRQGQMLASWISAPGGISKAPGQWLKCPVAENEYRRAGVSGRPIAIASMPDLSG
jgi:hypothetical protein